MVGQITLTNATSSRVVYAISAPWVVLNAQTNLIKIHPTSFIIKMSDLLIYYNVTLVWEMECEYKSSDFIQMYKKKKNAPYLSW